MKQREWRQQCRRKRLGRSRRRLFWRVYGFALLMLLLALFAFSQGANLVGVDAPWHDGPEKARRMLEAPTINGEPPDQDAIQERLQSLSRLIDMDLALYTRSGELVVSAGAEVPDPIPHDELADLSGPDWHWKGRDGWLVLMAAPVQLQGETEPHYVVATHDWRDAAATGAVGILLVLLACAIVMYPLTRRIVGPLERIAGAANRFGSGDLDARSNVQRKDEIGQLATAFDQMADRIQQLVLSEKELLANVSHEFRTPLARIRVALELAAETDDATRIRSRLEGIEEDIDELDRLVDDVLTAARLDQNGDAGFSLRPDNVDVAELVESSVERLKHAHPDALVAMAVDQDLTTLQADPVLVRRLLDNVLDNAAKYARDADDQPAPITVSARNSARGVRLEIRDRGTQLSPDDLERLAEPFFRADRSRSNAGGVGLGLALCHRIVEIHGGTLEFLDNDPGLMVLIELPESPRSDSQP